MNTQPQIATAEHPLSAVAVSFARNDRGTLGERAYSALRSVILAGDLAPHTRLSEVEIASIIPISRTPIREALKRLRSDGLVAEGSNRALFVRDLDLHECLHIYEILEVLEPLAVKLAARHISDEQIHHLSQSVELTAFFVEKERWDDVTAESRRFHELIYESGRNPRLTLLIRRLREESHRFRRFRVRNAELARVAIDEDREIVAALAAHDEERAFRIMADHIHASVVLIKDLLANNAQLDTALE